MNEFSLKILESNSIFYDGYADSLIVPTLDGMYGIQAGHINTILALTTGVIKYHIPKDDEVVYATVSEGMIKIEDNEVLILTDYAELPDEIDIKKEMHEIEEAKEKILQKKSRIEHKTAELAMARSLNRLKFKGYDTGDPQ